MGPSFSIGSSGCAPCWSVCGLCHLWSVFPAWAMGCSHLQRDRLSSRQHVVSLGLCGGSPSLSSAPQVPRSLGDRDLLSAHPPPHLRPPLRSLLGLPRTSSAFSVPCMSRMASGMGSVGSQGEVRGGCEVASGLVEEAKEPSRGRQEGQRKGGRGS